VSESLELAGVRVVLSDTAGLRASVDPVESIGVERARAALAESPHAIWVVDGSEPMTEDDHAVSQMLAGKRVLVALNKSDRGAVIPDAAARTALEGVVGRAVPVSARTGAGFGELRKAFAELLGAGERGEQPRFSTGNARHVDALERSRGALGRAAQSGQAGAPGEIVALELREAMTALGEVTGQSVSEDLLERIFSRFCVGK
jgi:tRNA modification GTPase